MKTFPVPELAGPPTWHALQLSSPGAPVNEGDGPEDAAPTEDERLSPDRNANANTAAAVMTIAILTLYFLSFISWVGDRIGRSQLLLKTRENPRRS